MYNCVSDFLKLVDEEIKAQGKKKTALSVQLFNDRTRISSFKSRGRNLSVIVMEDLAESLGYNLEITLKRK